MKAQLAAKAKVSVADVTQLTVWGNHSTTMYPDFENAKIKGRPVSEVARVFDPVPQKLTNFRYDPRGTVGRLPLDQEPVQQAIRQAERRLGRSGRLLIRKSGTEPVIRVMAEADDTTLVDAVIGEVIAALSAATAESPAEAAE